jgi:hypothetical protein
MNIKKILVNITICPIFPAKNSFYGVSRYNHIGIIGLLATLYEVLREHPLFNV